MIHMKCQASFSQSVVCCFVIAHLSNCLLGEVSISVKDENKNLDDHDYYHKYNNNKKDADS